MIVGGSLDAPYAKHHNGRGRSLPFYFVARLSKCTLNEEQYQKSMKIHGGMCQTGMQIAKWDL